MRSNDGMVMKLFSAQRYDPKQVSQSLVWCAEPHKKFFRAIQSQTVGYSKHNFGTPHRLPFRIRLPGGMKIQKSLCLHVWSLRMRSSDGMAMKLFSAQRYDPKHVSQSLVWCAESHKKVFRAIQSQTVGYSKHNFWDTSETSLQNQVARGYENTKIAMFARLVA